MPELPEVEVVRLGLAAHAVGAVIERVEVLHLRPVRRHLAGAAAFEADLVGRRITDARRRGKYLWLPLDHTDALVAHLGMSGQFLVRTPGAPAERNLRIRFGLSTGAELRFVDQRMFGGVWVSDGGAGLPAEISHIGLDPMDPGFDAIEVNRRIRRSVSGIKRQLLNQSLVSGIGNIYADEALWRAGIHPDRLGTRLNRTEAANLLDQVHAVMSAALSQGGTSFDSLYVDINGQSGYFDRSLHAYGREAQPCDRCGTPIRRVEFMNRSSYFCPACQRPPRARR